MATTLPTEMNAIGAADFLAAELIDPLRSQLRGNLFLNGDTGYDTSRTLWNAMIDRRPGVIVRAAGVADVIQAVNYARTHNLLLAIRGGGHNIAGMAVCDGGMMIDLSALKSVRVDPFTRTARVEPGVTLGEFDRECQAFGLATPVGINSTTGIAGLTLGGGFGWLSRKYGLTVDNLISADVVTAGGEFLHTSEKDNPDLFWAIRGGGGNFGVVTSFEFKLHPVGTEFLAGLIVHPLADAKAVLQQYREIMAKAPDEVVCWFVLRQAPPLPFLPPEWHGKEILALAMTYVGDVKKGEKELAPLRALGKPVGEFIAPTPYLSWQQLLDPMLTPGARNYWKSHNFSELSDEVIDTLIKFAEVLPSPLTELAVAGLGGAVNRLKPETLAYPHRDANYVLNMHTRWLDPQQDQECVSWARELFVALKPYATGGVYVNFIPEDETDPERVQKAAYGPNYERLAKIKAKYDPTNLFRQNQNIKPATA